MIGKISLAVGLAAAVLAVVSQRKDITRYLKIEQMSLGPGHPEVVPAGGSHCYPGPGQAAHEGTGDFDPAPRGGPAA